MPFRTNSGVRSHQLYFIWIVYHFGVPLLHNRPLLYRPIRIRYWDSNPQHGRRRPISPLLVVCSLRVICRQEWGAVNLTR